MRALRSFREELGKLRRGERSDLHPSEPRAGLQDDDLRAAENFVVELVAALGPLEGLRADRPHAFAELIERHRYVIAALTEDGSTVPAGFAGPDGAALAGALEEIVASESARSFGVKLADYSVLFHTAIADRVVRRPGLPGVRVRILGPLEARLTTMDRVVLGGLNEGCWPPQVHSDAWLSRPMRNELGLDLPERRISLSAHDFAQLVSAPEVILTRAAKAAGAPTVASRFVQRLAAVAGERWNTVRERGECYRGWARTLDRPAGRPKPVPRPEPKPPRAARPTRLSVTEIEHWLRDPYTIYAKNILRLRPLDPVDAAPGAADRGTVIHGAIGEFTQQFANGLPSDAFEALVTLGGKHFAALEAYPEARAFWWPRFWRIARWFANWETTRRRDVAAVYAEVQGAIEIPLGERMLTLSARADRIERLSDGRYAILDYKTGQAPTAPQVASGLAPQLTLEGAILRAGRFPNIPKDASIAAFMYVLLRGSDPAGDDKPIFWKDRTPDDEADKALKELTGIAIRFEDEATPYRSRERPMWRYRAYGDYDHLARVKEWSLSGGASDETEGTGE